MGIRNFREPLPSWPPTNLAQSSPAQQPNRAQCASVKCFCRVRVRSTEYGIPCRAGKEQASSCQLNPHLTDSSQNETILLGEVSFRSWDGSVVPRLRVLPSPALGLQPYRSLFPPLLMIGRACYYCFDPRVPASPGWRGQLPGSVVLTYLTSYLPYSVRMYLLMCAR